MNRWQDSVAAYMASSKVDQRFLGSFASAASHHAYDPSLSSMLYKLLGLSVIFSNKLNRAQTLRHLGGPILPHGGISDPSAEEEISETQHHVLWLAREGLMILEQYVLPSAELWDELRVLAQKMKASFYHAFVLFHNQPTVLSETEDQQVSDDGYGVSEHERDNENEHDAFSTTKLNDILGELPDPEEVPVAKGLESVLPTSELFSTLDSDLNLNTASTIHLRPPGLYVDEPAKFAASFLLPAIDFTPRTTACFSQAASTADALLPGSHPLRISVKVEYAAYLFDCLHDAEASRIVAKKAILDTYSATEHMDDESFEDAAELVHILGRIARNTRRKGGSRGSGSGSAKSARSTQRSAHCRSRSGIAGIAGVGGAMGMGMGMGMGTMNTWTFGDGGRRRHHRRALSRDAVEIPELFAGRDRGLRL